MLLLLLPVAVVHQAKVLGSMAAVTAAVSLQHKGAAAAAAAAAAGDDDLHGCQCLVDLAPAVLRQADQLATAGVEVDSHCRWQLRG